MEAGQLAIVATRRLEPDHSSRRSTSRQACPPARLGHSRWLARPGRKAASWLPTDSPMVQHRAVSAAAVKVCHAGECPMVCGSRAPQGVGVQGVRCWVPSVASVRQRCPAVAPHPALPRSLKQCPAPPRGLRWTRRRPCDCPLPLVKTRPSRRLRGRRPRAGVRRPVPVSGVRFECPASAVVVHRRGAVGPCSCRRSRASGPHSIGGYRRGAAARRLQEALAGPAAAGRVQPAPPGADHQRSQTGAQLGAG